MRVGHLFDAPRQERGALLSEICVEQDLEKYLEESYIPVKSFDDIPTPIIHSVQQGLIEAGKKLGEELVNEGHSFAESPGQVYPNELQAAVSAKIYPYVTRRIGQLDNGNPWAPWHFLNITLFLVAVFASAVEESGSDFSYLAWLAWLISVQAMFLVRFSKRNQTNKAQRESEFNKKYQILARPLLEAIDQELKKAGRHKELEDLVTRQSWPGRGMPGGVPYRDPTLPPQEKFTANPVRRPYLGKQGTRNSSQRGYQASTAKRAEEICATWLRSKREPSAEVTRDGADGGVDIRSNKYVAQVKNYKGSVPVQAIREIYGIASAEGKIPVFFTSGTYTKAAMDFADSVKMPLITYDAALQRFSGANLQGRMLA